MYINTRVGEISINNYHSKRIELTFPHWISVSLLPAQAIKVAHRLQNPLIDAWVDFADPNPKGPQGELRPIWDVMTVKHGNGVHTAWVGLQGSKLGIMNGINWAKIKSGPADYFRPDDSKKLTDKHIKKLCGLLYHWAGAMMIGYVTKRTVTKERVLHLEHSKTS